MVYLFGAQEQTLGIINTLKPVYPKAERIGALFDSEDNPRIKILEIYGVRKQYLRNRLPEDKTTKLDSDLNKILKQYKSVPWLRDQIWYCEEKSSWN